VLLSKTGLPPTAGQVQSSGDCRDISVRLLLAVNGWERRSGSQLAKGPTHRHMTDSRKQERMPLWRKQDAITTSPH
jgi:hypothetical protein